MAHQNEHLQWIAQSERLESQLPSSPETAVFTNVTQIVNLVRQQITSGEALVSLLQTPEGRTTVLPPGSVAIDARIAANKIHTIVERLKEKTRDYPDEYPGEQDQNDDERGGPPLSPVPIGGPRVGSNAAQAAIPPEAENDDPVVMEDEYVTMGPSDKVA